MEPKNQIIHTEDDANMTWKKLKVQYFSMFLFLTYLVLPSTTTTIFRIFLTQNLDPDNQYTDDGDYYLTADYSIHVDSSRYRFRLAWSIIMIFVYPGAYLLTFFLSSSIHSFIYTSLFDHFIDVFLHKS